MVEMGQFMQQRKQILVENLPMTQEPTLVEPIRFLHLGESGTKSGRSEALIPVDLEDGSSTVGLVEATNRRKKHNRIIWHLVDAGKKWELLAAIDPYQGRVL